MGVGFRVKVGDRYRGHPRTVVGNPGHKTRVHRLIILHKGGLD